MATAVREMSWQRPKQDGVRLSVQSGSFDGGRGCPVDVATQRVDDQVENWTRTAVNSVGHLQLTSSHSTQQHAINLHSRLFHRRTRASYIYNVCLALYNVVLTPRVHSSMKFVGLPLATRATVE